MKNVILILLVILNSFTISAQEVCESPEESVDLNSITKCTIKDSDKSSNKKTRQISVKVSARKRYLKKREAVKKQSANSLNGINTSGIQNTSTSSELTKSLAFKNSIKDVNKKLSKEELRKALKFTTVDRIPSFTACSDAKKGESLDCFNIEMVKHIQKYFRYPSKAVAASIQGEVWIRFIIDTDGNVRNIKALGPKNGGILKDEARRVVAHLPQFLPAKKKGKETSVKYGFPITFSLEE